MYDSGLRWCEQKCRSECSTTRTVECCVPMEERGEKEDLFSVGPPGTRTSSFGDEGCHRREKRNRNSEGGDADPVEVSRRKTAVHPDPTRKPRFSVGRDATGSLVKECRTDFGVDHDGVGRRVQTSANEENVKEGEVGGPCVQRESHPVREFRAGTPSFLWQSVETCYPRRRRLLLLPLLQVQPPCASVL